MNDRLKADVCGEKRGCRKQNPLMALKIVTHRRFRLEQDSKW